MKLSEQGVIPEEALLAYINNELTAEEKQELEKLLKDDPFAQDALEGLQQANKTSVAATVININKKVRERTGLKEKKIIQLHWTNYAWAAVVFGLLIGVGFLMVGYLGKQDNSIAMNKKAEEPVNLMEKKADEPTTTPVETSVTTDSVSLNTQNNVVANEGKNVESPAPDLKQTTTKTEAGKNDADGENKNTKTLVAPKQQTVTATGGAAAPSPAYMNSTILADDKGTVTGKTSGNAGLNNGVSKGKEKEQEKANAYRTANGDMERTEAKPIVKEELKKKNTEQKKEDNAPAAETVMRGAIIEKVEANKVTVITMDDAMKNFNNGDYKTSSEQFSEILKQQPNNADALYFGGISDYINGNTKKSERNFDKLLKDGTKFAEGSKWYKANILLKKGKKEEAKKILDELANTGGSYKERAVKKKAEMEF